MSIDVTDINHRPRPFEMGPHSYEEVPHAIDQRITWYSRASHSYLVIDFLMLPSCFPSTRHKSLYFAASIQKKEVSLDFWDALHVSDCHTSSFTTLSLQHRQLSPTHTFTLVHGSSSSPFPLPKKFPSSVQFSSTTCLPLTTSPTLLSPLSVRPFILRQKCSVLDVY